MKALAALSSQLYCANGDISKVSIRSNFARALTALLVATICMFAAQNAIAAVDRAQHSFGVAHAPTAVAGTVHQSHDHDHGHDVDVASEHTDDPQQDSDPGRASHHHSGEIPHASTVHLVRIAELTSHALENDQALRIDRPRLRLLTRLERPPKAASKTL